MTIASLYKRLKFLADATPTTIRSLKSGYAHVVFHDGAAKITLSPTDPETGETLPLDTRIRKFQHELIHIAIPAELAALGTFEEKTIERVFEPELLSYTLAKPSRRAWWVKRLGV